MDFTMRQHQYRGTCPRNHGCAPCRSRGAHQLRRFWHRFLAITLMQPIPSSPHQMTRILSDRICQKCGTASVRSRIGMIDNCRQQTAGSIRGQRPLRNRNHRRQLRVNPRRHRGKLASRYGTQRCPARNSRIGILTSRAGFVNGPRLRDVHRVLSERHRIAAVHRRRDVIRMPLIMRRKLEQNVTFPVSIQPQQARRRENSAHNRRSGRTLAATMRNPVLSNQFKTNRIPHIGGYTKISPRAAHRLHNKVRLIPRQRVGALAVDLNRNARLLTRTHHQAVAVAQCKAQAVISRPKVRTGSGDAYRHGAPRHQHQTAVLITNRLNVTHHGYASPPASPAETKPRASATVCTSNGN